MPSGPAHLHARFGDDWVAWKYLQRRGFTMAKGFVSPPFQSYVMSQMEDDAVDYLLMEWDWDYNVARAPESLSAASPLGRCRRYLLRLFSGPLRVRDRHLRDLQMWWHCDMRFRLRRRWYILTGRRKLWEEGEEVIGSLIDDEFDA